MSWRVGKKGAGQDRPPEDWGQGRVYETRLGAAPAETISDSRVG